MKIIWTQEALDRLTEVEGYIAQASPERGLKFIDQLSEHTSLLSYQPCSGRTVREIANPDIGEIIVKKHRIVYRLKKNRIEVWTLYLKDICCCGLTTLRRHKIIL